MIEIQIEGLDEVKAGLSDFGSNAKKMLSATIRIVANNYRKYVVNNYLSGQYLNRRSGLTVESLIAYRNKKLGDAAYTIGNRLQNRGNAYVPLANIFECDEDIVITAKNKKAIRFIGQDMEIVFRRFATVKPKHFMTDSSNRYDFDNDLEKSADIVIDRQIKKSFKE